MMSGELLKLAAARIMWNRMKIAQALYNQATNMANNRNAMNTPDVSMNPGLNALGNSWNNFTNGVGSLWSGVGGALGGGPKSQGMANVMGGSASNATTKATGIKPIAPGKVK